MKYACVKCQQFFHIKRNGVMMEEGMPATNGPSADGQPNAWSPYKLFLADLYECRKCGTQLAVPSLNPFAEHFMSHYDQMKEQYRLRGLLLPMIEDC